MSKNIYYRCFSALIMIVAGIGGLSPSLAAAQTNNISRKALPQNEPPAIADKAGVPFDFRHAPLFQETGFRAREWSRVLKLETQDPVFDREIMHTDDAELAAEWNQLYAKLSYAPRETQIRYVNQLFNTWIYKDDLKTYGQHDYWASPREFIANAGDCEDYAIIKYFAMRALGVPARDLCIVVLYVPKARIGHAVLVVQDYDGFYVLDNDSDAIVARNNSLELYIPEFYINEEGIWRH